MAAGIIEYLLIYYSYGINAGIVSVFIIMIGGFFMKKLHLYKVLLMALFAFLFCIPSFPVSPGAILGGKAMVLNGKGERTEMITVYFASLFVPQELKGASATQIIEADQPMAIEIKIDSRFVSRDKFLKAVKEGLEKAAGAGYGTTDMQTYTGLFNNAAIKKYDIIEHLYEPKKGMTVVYKGQVLGTIKGIQFKKAFFAMYLGSKPVQGKLKEQMLGK